MTNHLVNESINIQILPDMKISKTTTITMNGQSLIETNLFNTGIIVQFQNLTVLLPSSHALGKITVYFTVLQALLGEDSWVHPSMLIDGTHQ